MLKVAVAIYCLVGALIVYGGLGYLTASEFMPYHAQALQADWNSLNPAQQGLVLSLMKGRGGTAVTVGIAVVLLAVIGLLRGTRFVFWLLPLFALLYLGFATYSTYFMHAHTADGPPMLLGPILGGFVVLGAVLSYAGRRSAASPAQWR